MVGRFLAVREEERKIIRDGFVDPLIAIAGPANDVAPPLMSDFVERNKFPEMLLAHFGEANALLSRGGKKRVCGKIKKPRPALAETAWNLRDTEFVEGKWSAKSFIEMDGRVDLSRELLESVG